jgi:hypothetical protein
MVKGQSLFKRRFLYGYQQQLSGKYSAPEYEIKMFAKRNKSLLKKKIIIKYIKSNLF